MSDNTFDIYFSDLTPAAQQEFLALIGEKNIKNTNYDILPISSVPAPEPELQEIKLYSPLSIAADINDGNEDVYEDISSFDAVDFEAEITAHFVRELSRGQNEIRRGLMAYYRKDDGVAKKVRRIGVTTEVVDGQLMGVATLSAYAPLTAQEMTALKNYLIGQYSDGFGENMEQRPVKTDIGKLYVSLWQSSGDFCIQTEQEMSTVRKHMNRGDAR